jgi:hypothetical protein
MWGSTFQHFLQDLVDIYGILYDEVQSDKNTKLLINCYGYNGRHVKELIDLLGM